jgi:hypothetical protein
MNVETGLRDKLVTIEGGTPGTTGSGTPTVTWNVAIGDEWMSKHDVRGTELLAAAQFNANVDSEWEFPYRADMDPDLVDVPKLRRLSFSGRKYNILRAIKRQRHEGNGIRLVTLATTGR